jgi:SsrA-binding protein
MATKEASSSKKPAAASGGKPGKPEAKLSPKAAAAAVRIADNKKANFNYHIEERFEAGMVLEGWEVKSVREGKVQLTDGYVVIRNGEVFIIGCQINPLGTASTHVRPDSIRTKKLLLHKDEIKRLMGKVEQKGFTLVPLNMHWKNGRVKCEIGLAKGKGEHDKRDTIKDREGKREVERAMKSKNR